MCYNCGCGEPDDNMGKPRVTGASLTNESFEEMAKAWNMTSEEAKKETYKLLKKHFEK